MSELPSQTKYETLNSPIDYGVSDKVSSMGDNVKSKGEMLAWQKEAVEDGIAVVVYCGCPGRENVAPSDAWEGQCLTCGQAYSIAKTAS